MGRSIAGVYTAIAKPIATVRFGERVMGFAA
jgi:hypothetical protein